MQQDYYSLIKNVFIEYAKSHNECSGKILEILNHIDEAAKVAQSLPLNVQEELKGMLYNGLMVNGISSIFFK